MTNRFYIPDLKTSSPIIRLTDKRTIHQITRVLRQKIGDVIFVFSPTEDVELKITKIQDDYIEATVINKQTKQTDHKISITLYQALLKKDKFEWIIQKATELGVKKIVPIITKHAITREISQNKIIRFEKIASEATEQCGGLKPPIISDLIEFDQAVEAITKEHGIKIIPWEGENNTKISGVLNKKETDYHIIIGPEGGLTNDEIKKASDNKIIPVSLGNRILRAETAAIAAISLILLNDI